MTLTLNREVLCTVGPASLNERVLVRLEDLGVSLFRINLSHTKLKDLPAAVDFIRSHTAVPVCLDTEGAQVRTGDLVNGEVTLRENTIVHAHRQAVPGDANNLNFYPLDIVDELQEDDFISVDFNAVLVQVVEKTADRVSMRVIHGGVVGRNKAVTVERDLPLAPLTHKDMEALKWGRSAGIAHVALSFANRGSDVDAVRAISGEGVFLISKIECRAALHNLDEIAIRSDALLIDRGDLSRQEPIERIPSLQKMIIRRGAEQGRRVYVATNLLESMITAPKPTRAEVNDVVNTLLDGANGLVLAAETAIGRDPVGCVSMIVKLIHEYNLHRATAEGVARHYRASDGMSLLVEPHGGVLVEQTLPASGQIAAETLPKLAVDHQVLLDAQQIALGTYSPLTGFMDGETLASVLATNRLPDGTPWTMPILLPIPTTNASRFAPGQTIALTDGSGRVHAVVEVGEVYSYDITRLGRQLHGEAPPTHPGVRRLQALSGHFLAGKVSLARRLTLPHRQYELAPRESRFVLQHKGWNKVVGFNARSPANRLDEHVQLAALEHTGADGLLVNTIFSPVPAGDFPPDIVLRSYQMMLDFGYYPQGKALIAAQPAYARHAGPREAVFATLCQKNLGCSHFIIDLGASAAEPGYRESDYHALFDELGDLGITPLFVGAVGYDSATRRYGDRNAADRVANARWLAIRSSEAHHRLSRNDALPDWFMREVIQDMLRAHLTTTQPDRDHAFAC